MSYTYEKCLFPGPIIIINTGVAACATSILDSHKRSIHHMEALSPTSLFPCLTPSSDVVADSFPREETEETVLGLKIEVIKV